jgi:4-amino-4-deoxychorismate lyase
LLKEKDLVSNFNNICFETIKVKDGKLLNLTYHQNRVNNTRSFFGFNDILELKQDYFNLPKYGEFRLRVDYDKEIRSFKYEVFKNRVFKNFKIVNSDIEYKFKYSNRNKINILKADNSEIIVVKNGLIRDTSIANIALYIDDIWLTPRTPLLKGTTRARLLNNGFLKCEDLVVEDLKKVKNFAIMNALIDFKIIKNFLIT